MYLSAFQVSWYLLLFDSIQQCYKRKWDLQEKVINYSDMSGDNLIYYTNLKGPINALS